MTDDEYYDLYVHDRKAYLEAVIDYHSDRMAARVRAGMQRTGISVKSSPPPPPFESGMRTVRLDPEPTQKEIDKAVKRLRETVKELTPRGHHV